MTGPITFITMEEAKIIIKYLTLYGGVEEVDRDIIYALRQRLILEIARDEKRTILKQMRQKMK